MTPPRDSESVHTLVELVASEPTEVTGLRVGGIPVWDEDGLAPLILRPGDRLRVIVDRPGWSKPKERK
jgi:hypothetical protein